MAKKRAGCDSDLWDRWEVLATNRGVCTIRGTEIVSPHGMPVDLLDRMVICRTLGYSVDEIVQVHRTK